MYNKRLREAPERPTKQNKKIRRGDKVIVLAGNDKGTVGEVLSRTPDRITIGGVNIRKKHVKKSEAHPQGGIIEMEKSIHISNVAICVDEEKRKKLKVTLDDKGNRLYAYTEGKNKIPYRNIKKQS